MDVAKKALAVYLMAAALVVAAHFMFSSFYREVVDPIAVWGVLDWFMAVGIVAALGVHARRVRAADEASGPAGLAANAALWITLLLALWFFWNWFDFLNLETDAQSVVSQTIWAIIDPLFVLVACATGRYLWQHADG